MIRTGAQFLESLRDGRCVFVGGEQIDDLTTHPKTKDYAQRLAEYYDLHHDPEYEDQLTFVDEDGQRYSKTWLLPRSPDDVAEHRQYHEFWFRHFAGGAMTRLPASQNTVYFTLIDDPEPWADHSIDTEHVPIVQNIQENWEFLRSNDLFTSPLFIDVQQDRSREISVEESPMLRVVDRTDEGIVVNGWKATATASIFADQLLLGNLWKPGTHPEHVVFALVPSGHPGVTHVSRPSYATPDENPLDRPFSTMGDELDSMTFFDNVSIPWNKVFHLGNVDHAKLYPQRLFDWEHVETQIRHAVYAELLAGFAILVTQALGTAETPIIASAVADLVRFRETCRAFTIASEATGFYTPGGLYKPNNTFVDFGRAYYLENYPKMVDSLIEFCGRSSILLPTEADFDNETMGPRLTQLFRGRNISAQDKVRLFKTVHDRYLSDWAGRHLTFEKFQATPLFVIRILTMQRVEYSPDGPLTQLARKVAGLGTTTELAERADNEAAGLETIGFKWTGEDQPEYIKRQDVRTT
jgi:aromatic ring hydroxylase